MNKKQKYFLVKLISVFIVTVITITAVNIFKDFVNRSESLLAMNNLGALINQYIIQNGKLPPESYIEDIKANLQGSARLGQLVYRNKWLGYIINNDTVLIYSKKDYSDLFLGDGYVVLKYNGQAQWLTKNDFQITMALEWAKDEPRE